LNGGGEEVPGDQRRKLAATCQEKPKTKKTKEQGIGETKNDENRQCGSRRRTVVWRGAGLQQTVGWLLGSPTMTFRPATCVDGAPALGLRQCGSRRCWVSGAF
jgi:hypothetical protein